MLGTVQKSVQRSPLETPFLIRGGLIILGSENVGEGGQLFLSLQTFFPQSDCPSFPGRTVKMTKEL